MMLKMGPAPSIQGIKKLFLKIIFANFYFLCFFLVLSFFRDKLRQTENRNTVKSKWNYQFLSLYRLNLRLLEVYKHRRIAKFLSDERGRRLVREISITMQMIPDSLWRNSVKSKIKTNCQLSYNWKKFIYDFTELSLQFTVGQKI